MDISIKQKFRNSDKDTGLVPNLNFKKEKIKHCLLNSFGFGAPVVH